MMLATRIAAHEVAYRERFDCAQDDDAQAPRETLRSSRRPRRRSSQGRSPPSSAEKTIRKRARNADRRKTSRSGAAYERISSIDSGSTDVSPRNVFTSTGKKHRTAAIVTFDQGLRSPNHAFVIGANAMMGTAFAAIMYGIRRVAERTPAREDERGNDRGAAPEYETADCFLEGDPRTAQEQRRARRSTLGRRRRAAEAGSPRPRARPGGTTARRQARGRRRRPRAAQYRSRSPSRDGVSAVESSVLITISLLGHERLLDLVGTRGVQRLPNLSHELEEAWLFPRRSSAWLRQVNGYDARDPARPRGHHDHTRGQEHRLGDRVGDEDHRRARLRPDAEQLQVETLPCHLVERAERLVHEQERRREGKRPRDRDALLHTSRELPGMVLLEPVELDELDHVLDARLHASLGPSRASRGAGRCSSRRCASRRGQAPGTRSRSRDRAAPGGPTSR